MEDGASSISASAWAAVARVSSGGEHRIQCVRDGAGAEADQVELQLRDVGNFALVVRAYQVLERGQSRAT